MVPTAKHMGQTGKRNFSPVNQLQFITKSWVITNEHFIKSKPNDQINMMTAMNCWHLLRNTVILIIFIIISEIIRKQRKKFDQMKHFDGPNCLILFNVDNTISTATGMDETTAPQLSTVVCNGLIHRC